MIARIDAGGRSLWTPGVPGGVVLLPPSIEPVRSRREAERVLGHAARPSEGRFVAVALAEIARIGNETLDAVLRAYEVGCQLPESLRKNDGTATGFICEGLGRQRLAQLFPDCSIEHGVTLHAADGQTLGELDAVMRGPDGDIVALAEVKLRPDALAKGKKKLRSLLEGIQAGSLHSYKLPDGTSHRFNEPGPYARDRFATVDAMDCLGVTCRDGQTDLTAVCVDLSYQSICRVASILTHYAGLHTLPPQPDLDALLRRSAA